MFQMASRPKSHLERAYPNTKATPKATLNKTSLDPSLPPAFFVSIPCAAKLVADGDPVPLGLGLGLGLEVEVELEPPRLPGPVNGFVTFDTTL